MFALKICILMVILIGAVVMLYTIVGMFTDKMQKASRLYASKEYRTKIRTLEAERDEARGEAEKYRRKYVEAIQAVNSVPVSSKLIGKFDDLPYNNF